MEDRLVVPVNRRPHRSGQAVAGAERVAMASRKRPSQPSASQAAPAVERVDVERELAGRVRRVRFSRPRPERSADWVVSPPPVVPMARYLLPNSIPARRAKSLFRWNAVLALLHTAQALVVAAVSRTEVRFAPIAETVKVSPNPAGGRPLIEPVDVTLFDIPLAALIVAFFAASALAHFTAAFPLRARYENWLARGKNPLRWIEYSISSTIMILAIASLSFIETFPALVGIAAANVAMNLFGWSMEDANERRERIRWKHYLFGCVVGLAPWIAIGTGLAAYGLQPDLDPAYSIPAFVYVIYGSLFVSFNIFALIMVLQYRKVGRWADYLVGEKSYMILSLLAKTLLAWQVWSGTLRPM
jgi:hypothetical protein